MKTMADYYDFLIGSGKGQASINIAKLADRHWDAAGLPFIGDATAEHVKRFARALHRYAGEDDARQRTALQVWREAGRILTFAARGDALRQLKLTNIAGVLRVVARIAVRDWREKALNDEQVAALRRVLAGMERPPAAAGRAMFLRDLNGYWRRPLFLLLAATGCRVSEICTLTFAGVRDGGRTLRVVGKGRKERDVCVLWDEAVEALAEWTAFRRASYGGYGEGVDGGCFVFYAGCIGTRHVTPRTVEAEFNKILVAIGAARGGRNVHCLRHTFATRQINAKAEAVMLQQQLGHASLSTTMHYARPSTETVRAGLRLET